MRPRQRMATLADTPINPLTLTFADPALETDFRADHRGQSLAPIRLSLAAALAMYILLGLLDRSLAPQAYRSIWLFRYAVVCPFLGGMLLLSFTPSFRRLQGIYLGVGAVSAGLGSVLILLAIYLSDVADSSLYIALLCLYLVFGCLALRLRFVVAAGFCAAVGSGYCLLWLAPGRLAGLPVGSVALAASAALGLAGAYALERSRRAEYFHRRKLDSQLDELNRARQEALLKRQEVDALARVDELTGLATRKHFFEIAERELDRCRRYAHPLAVIILDLDHFKVVNDTFGHAIGDRVLEAVSGQILANVREADTVCRFGGEEFAVVFPETSREAALQVGERLRGFIESLRIDAPIGRLSVTVSAGLAATASEEKTALDDLLACADRALLAAKEAGRNRVIVWDVETAPQQ
jgi:diguanylate cyclase (GGDEF)-like protein